MLFGHFKTRPVGHTETDRFRRVAPKNFGGQNVRRRSVRFQRQIPAAGANRNQGKRRGRGTGVCEQMRSRRRIQPARRFVILPEALPLFKLRILDQLSVRPGRAEANTIFRLILFPPLKFLGVIRLRKPPFRQAQVLLDAGQKIWRQWRRMADKVGAESIQGNEMWEGRGKRNAVNDVLHCDVANDIPPGPVRVRQNLEQFELRQRPKRQTAFARRVRIFFRYQLQCFRRRQKFPLLNQPQTLAVAGCPRKIPRRVRVHELFEGLVGNLPIGVAGIRGLQRCPQPCLFGVQFGRIERLWRWQRIPRGRENQTAGRIHHKRKGGVCPRLRCRQIGGEFLKKGIRDGLRPLPRVVFSQNFVLAQRRPAEGRQHGNRQQDQHPLPEKSRFAGCAWAGHGRSLCDQLTRPASRSCHGFAKLSGLIRPVFGSKKQSAAAMSSAPPKTPNGTVMPWVRLFNIPTRVGPR